MIIAVGILAFMAICALSLAGLGESHTRVSRILTELDNNRVNAEAKDEAPAATQPEEPKADVFSEVAFTRSLLALSKVRSLSPYATQELEPAESSSLVLVHHAQSKNLAPKPGTV